MTFAEYPAAAPFSCTVPLTMDHLLPPASVIVTLIALAALGLTGARLGGANQTRATVRVTAWGAIAMAVTYGIGALVGTAT